MWRYLSRKAPARSARLSGRAGRSPSDSSWYTSNWFNGPISKTRRAITTRALACAGYIRSERIAAPELAPVEIRNLLEQSETYIAVRTDSVSRLRRPPT